MIDVGPLLAIDFDVHEELVHHRGRRGIFEALMRHDMTPMASGIADGEKDRLILRLRFLERGIAPHAPMDWIVCMLQEIGARGAAEFV